MTKVPNSSFNHSTSIPNPTHPLKKKNKKNKKNHPIYLTHPSSQQASKTLPKKKQTNPIQSRRQMQTGKRDQIIKSPRALSFTWTSTAPSSTAAPSEPFRSTPVTLPKSRKRGGWWCFGWVRSGTRRRSGCCLGRRSGDVRWC